jgi:hypothetical protein
MQPAQVYEVRPRKDRRGVDLISDALPFGGLWYGKPNAIANAIGYAEHYSRSHRAVIRVYDSGVPNPPVSTCNAGWRFAIKACQSRRIYL